MATSVDLGSVLDRAYEDKTLQEILNAPPSGARGSHGTPQPGAFRGLRHPDRRRNGKQQHFALAGVLVALAGKL
jgi:hypothetical protein